MKYIYIIILIFAPLFVQCQNWQWAKQAGGNALQSYDGGYVITDGTNYYLYGTFSGTIFLQTDTFNANGNSDFFVIKYDGNGTEIWARAFGGFNGTNQGETMEAVYDQISNSIYLAGIFNGTMYLGNDTLNGNVYYNNFLAKMDLSGNFIWAKNAWTKNTFNLTFADRGPGLSVQKNGIINIITSVIDTAFFDGLSVIPGGCMAKFDGNGNCFFVRHFFDFTTPPPSWNQGGFGIQYLNTDLIISGSFKQTLNIDTATLTSNGDYDMLLACADSIGSIKWIKQFGFSSTDYITHLGIDNSNNLFAVGGFTDSISFNGNSYYNSASDFIFMKFDANGNFILANQAHSSTAFINPGRMMTDGDGNSYISGSFSGSASFGNYNISTSNMNDMFLARYNNIGDCLGVRHFGKAGGGNVVIDNSGNPVVAGVFANTVSIGSNNFTSNGPFDVYLAKSDIFTGIGGEGRMANKPLVIYANPNAGKCNIIVPEEFQNKNNLNLSIYNSMGILIQQQLIEMKDGKIKLDLEAEAKGVYTVSLSDGKKSYSGKIVFE